MNQQINLLLQLQLLHADSTGNISHTKADFEGAEIKGSTGNFVSTGVGTVLTVSGNLIVVVLLQI